MFLLLVLASGLTVIFGDNKERVASFYNERNGGGLPWYAKPGNPVHSDPFGYGGLNEILTSDSGSTILKNCTDSPVTPDDQQGQLVCSNLPNVANKGCLTTTIAPYYQCVCEDGYGCPLCEIRKNPCYPGVKQHYCNETNSVGCTANDIKPCHPPICECKPGWTTSPGDLQCSEDVNECKETPSVCENGGECVNTIGSYKCLCNAPYGGPGCKHSDHCHPDRTKMAVPCAADAECLNKTYKGSTYAHCICPPGRGCLGNPYLSCCENSFEQNMYTAGDPHYMTFDGYPSQKWITYQGTCPITLARMCKQAFEVPYFKVVSRSTTECANNNKFSCLRYIYIDIDNHRIRLDGKDPTKIRVNDSYTVPLPYTELAPLLTVTQSWEVKTSFAMKSSFYSPQPYHGTSNSYTLTFYDGSGTFANKMCGIGGNMNGDPSDDLMMPNGVIAADPVTWGDSWAAENIGDYDSLGCLLGKDILVDNKELRDNQTWAAADTFCHYLTDGKGIFEQCFENMDKTIIENYYRNCYYDIANHRTSIKAELVKVNDRVCKTYLTKFVDECKNAILHNHKTEQCVLGEWRAAAGCPNPSGAKVCTEHAHWDDCATADICMNTCLNPEIAYNCPTKQVQARCDCDVDSHQKYVFDQKTQGCVPYPHGCPGNMKGLQLPNNETLSDYLCQNECLFMGKEHAEATEKSSTGLFCRTLECAEHASCGATPDYKRDCVCDPGYIGDGRHECRVPQRHCADLQTYHGVSESGVDNNGIWSFINRTRPVFCDTKTDSGNWTLIQRRVSTGNFNRSWTDYVNGFGDDKLDHSFWYGLEMLHLLTTYKHENTLRIDLEDCTGKLSYQIYDYFKVGDNTTNYVMTYGGTSGTAGDAFSSGFVSPNGMPFSTFDRDHDGSEVLNCAALKGSGWWHNQCTNANLNGKYYPDCGGAGKFDAATWYVEGQVSQPTCMKRMEMKIKPTFVTGTPQRSTNEL